MRLIDADILADRLDAIAYHDWNQGTSVSWADAFKVAAEIVRNERVIDAEPVKHGHWKKTITWWIYCSVCGSEPPSECNIPTPYCPWCGAKMDEDEWQEPEINPCRGCVDYDGQGGCKSNGGCGVEMDGERKEDV